MNKEIVFWGSEPPPIGGMTVHIKRLSAFLRMNGWRVSQYNFNCPDRKESHIINVRNLLQWYLKIWFTRTPNIHYVITTTSYVRFLSSLLTLRGKKVVLRVGGRSLEKGLKSNIVEKYMNILSLKLCSSFIGVSSEICNIASKYTSEGKVNLIPGFIPPLGDDVPSSLVVDFFKNASLKIVITGQVVSTEEEDIYGLFHALESLKILKEKGVLFKCCIVSYTISDNNDLKIKSFREHIASNNLSDEVLLFHNTNELWPIIKISDLFIRPTITDGDANSIREALFLNKTVIASDCVERPESCIIYESSNSEDLANKIKFFGVNNQPVEVNVINNSYPIMRLLENL